MGKDMSIFLIRYRNVSIYFKKMDIACNPVQLLVSVTISIARKNHKAFNQYLPKAV